MSEKRYSIPRVCQNCLIEFMARKDSIKAGYARFCSKECSHESRRLIKIKRICKTCSNEFEVMPRVVKIGTGNYCSWSCRSKICSTLKRLSPEEIFWRNIIPPKHKNDCWLFKCINSSGYGTFQYIDNISEKRISIKAHRFSWELHNNKKIPKGFSACHHCDNPPCCNPSHIFIGTQSDNAFDMIKKGRAKTERGSQRYNAVLNEELVLKIKIMISENIRLYRIAKELNIPTYLIQNIKNGSWKHVTLP